MENLKEEKEKKEKVIKSCSKCGSKFNYTRVDGSMVCRKCGYIQHKEK